MAFRAVVVAVVVLMGLNFGELLWVNGWQDQTDQAVRRLADRRPDFAIAVDRMAASVGDLSSLLVENSGVEFLANAFKSNGGGAAAALGLHPRRQGAGLGRGRPGREPEEAQLG